MRVHKISNVNRALQVFQGFDVSVTTLFYVCCISKVHCISFTLLLWVMEHFLPLCVLSISPDFPIDSLESIKLAFSGLTGFSKFLFFLQTKLVNIRSEEIVDGNTKLILGLVWSIILQFQVFTPFILARVEPLTDHFEVLGSSGFICSSDLVWSIIYSCCSYSISNTLKGIPLILVGIPKQLISQGFLRIIRLIEALKLLWRKGK